jgi:general secretion pathway protein C
MSGHQLARSAAFFAWAAAAACAVYWALLVGVSRPGLPPGVLPVSGSGALRGDLARLLGAGPSPAGEVAAQPALASRFRLFGVVAPKVRPGAVADPAQGVALIAIDGKAPRAFRVGSRVDGELMLKSVAQRSAQIGAADGSVALRLELAPPAPPATGTLPSAASGLVPPGGMPARPAPPLQPAPPGLAMPGVPFGQMVPAAPPVDVMPPEGAADPSMRR